MVWSFWSLSTGASTDVIGCSCHITLSADTCHLCDIRIRMPAAGVCHHFQRLFPSHSPGQHQVNNRDSLTCRRSSASPLYAGSRLQPATLRCSVCRPTVHSPHPPAVTLYTGKTGEIQSRLIYDISKRRHWRLSIIIAVTAPSTCLRQWRHWRQGPWLTG